MKNLSRLLAFVIYFIWAASALADPHPAGLKNHDFNGPSQPFTKDGITTFHIDNHGCSDVKYGDGRGESDCYNGNVRSAISTKKDDRLGESFEYRFDIKVDEGLRYRGWYNDHSLGYLTGGRDSRLRLAYWEGNFLHNFLYILKLDAQRGIVFHGQTCVPANEITEWHSFSMKIRWASDKKGWIKVTCDDRVVWLIENAATNQAPHCYITNQCEKGVFKNPKRMLFQLGLSMSGFGYEWEKYGKLSQFTEIQPEGITVRMRNIAITRGSKLYTSEDRVAIKTLQTRLNALGCDVGVVDGVIGPRTRDAARDCREFSQEEWPGDLDVGTLHKIKTLYENNYPAY